MLLGGLLSMHYILLSQRDKFDESVAHFEAVLRLARAEASSTGKRLRMEFLDDGAFKITGELEPLTDPNNFQDYQKAHWAQDLPCQWIKVSACRITAPTLATVLGTGATGQGPAMPPILFYPDGSSDSATLEIVSRDAGDARTVVIDVDGVNSTITRRMLLPSELEEYHKAVGTAQ